MSSVPQPLSMKIMLLVLHKCRWAMLRVKSNLTKHIAPKFFYPDELQKSGEVQILYTKSCENLADLFTKSLPPPSFLRCVHGIGMRRLREMQGLGEAMNHSP